MRGMLEREQYAMALVAKTIAHVAYDNVTFEELPEDASDWQKAELQQRKDKHELDKAAEHQKAHEMMLQATEAIKALGEAEYKLGYSLRPEMLGDRDELTDLWVIGAQKAMNG